MPDGASSQGKLFSHSQSGETLGQSKSHHSLPLYPCLSPLATRETGVVKDPSGNLPSPSTHLPAPCPVSELQAHETVGLRPESSVSAQGKTVQGGNRYGFWKFLQSGENIRSPRLSTACGTSRLTLKC